MPDVPTKSYWMGKDIETLNREELLDVVRYLAHDLEETRRSVRSMVEIHALARKARERDLQKICTACDGTGRELFKRDGFVVQDTPCARCGGRGV
jgi:DnaJ-class molecular chaperone